MRTLIKRHFPTLFAMAKKFYHRTTWYRSAQQRAKLHQERVRQVRAKEEVELVSKFFQGNFLVHNGPFKGMKYIRRSAGFALLPKLLGSYEEPIHEWIEEIAQKQYQRIIDIGCAEGYYAVGLALRSPGSEIFAFDIEPTALRNSEELAFLNGVDHIKFGGECGFTELNNLSSEKTLVFCDIEGFEVTLLDPRRAPRLLLADLLVECHDFIVDGATEALIKRFQATHRVRISIDYKWRKAGYLLPENPTSSEFYRITNEFRQDDTRYIFMQRLKSP